MTQYLPSHGPITAQWPRNDPIPVHGCHWRKNGPRDRIYLQLYFISLNLWSLVAGWIGRRRVETGLWLHFLADDPAVCPDSASRHRHKGTMSWASSPGRRLVLQQEMETECDSMWLSWTRRVNAKYILQSIYTSRVAVPLFSPTSMAVRTNAAPYTSLEALTWGQATCWWTIHHCWPAQQPCCPPPSFKRKELTSDVTCWQEDPHTLGWLQYK